ncbi:MAG: polysaccharide pyruvyl transferase family protein [Bacteroidaceae bacterium]|nr:polysaccharide pyruvyl transferase family protein [Bacteroidaceae bacterium]
MKFGILTYHRTNNYGALLQAVATRYYLQKQGHEVYYIDYWPDYHRDMYALFDQTRYARSGLLMKLLIIGHTLINYSGRKARIKRFEPFIAKYIAPYCKPYTGYEHYEVVIYGSDQIWRKQISYDNRFNHVYFGNNKINADRHIAYAASMGEINISERDRIFLKDSLKKFDSLMVREDDLNQLLHELGFSEARVVLDPTLLLTSGEWDMLMPINRLVKEPYVMLYQMDNSISRKHAKEFAKKRNLKLVILGAKYDCKHPNDITTTTPEEFLSLIKYADVVLTSSYHGLVFSINYKKNFYCSFKNTNRAKTILAAIGLENRMMEARQALPEIDPEINWDAVSDQLKQYRNNSKNIFQQSITTT